MPARNFRRRAFSLVELLVVIGIIALLMAMLLPAVSHARAQADMLKCKAVLRDMGIAAHLHVLEHAGYLPLGGKHWDADLNPAGGAGVNDIRERKYIYYNDEGVQRPVPFTIALAITQGAKVRLDSRENLEADMQNEDIIKRFRCPSQVLPLRGLTQGIGQWQAPHEWSSYVFNEAILGMRDKKTNPDPPMGKIGRVKQPSEVMLSMDGRPRGPTGSAVNWLYVMDLGPGWTVWEFQQVAMNPKNDWCGREGLDFLRHSYKANVLFCDGHVDMIFMTKDGLSSVGVSKGVN